MKYLGVPGDGDTLSITLAIDPEDRDLRAALSDPDGFEQACRLLPGPDQFFRDGPLEPVGGVRPMGGLLNRLRRFTDDDGAAPRPRASTPSATPTPARTRSTAEAARWPWSRPLAVAAALAEHPDDPVARAEAYEAASATGGGSPRMPSRSRWTGWGPTPPAARAADSPAGRGHGCPPRRRGHRPGARPGPARFWNLLATRRGPHGRPAYTTRAMEVMADPDAYPIPERDGPSRRELLAALAESAAA